MQSSSVSGEIELEDLVFGGTLGWMTFLLFVFLIMLILVNLLNGLAVSDIAQIQKEAEVMSQVSRVKLLYQLESILLSFKLNRIVLTNNFFLIFSENTYAK